MSVKKGALSPGLQEYSTVYGNFGSWRRCSLTEDPVTGQNAASLKTFALKGAFWVSFTVSSWNEDYSGSSCASHW